MATYFSFSKRQFPPKLIAVLHNACWIIPSLFANLKLLSVLFIHKTFLVYKLEIFTNCKEVKHIMIMIIAIIYIFFYLMRYLIKSWKLLSENPRPSSPWKKIPLKKVTSFCHYWRFFKSLLEKGGPGGWRTLCFL